LQYSNWLLLLYIAGVFSAVYHFANGLWTAAITWGATVTVASQKRWAYICLALGITLAGFSAIGIGKAYSYPLTEKQRADHKEKLNAPQTPPHQQTPEKKH